MGHVVVVGAGVLGTMHAVLARRAGHTVTHLERDGRPRSASVRNFGMVWVSGRAVGEELTLALRARELWEEVAGPVEGTGFRANGSLTVAQHPAEVAVLEQVAERDDAERRGVRLLDPAATRDVNPALRGSFLAALHCSRDALVEPRSVLDALLTSLAADDGYALHVGHEVVEVGPQRVTDHLGAAHRGDLVVLCPGAGVDGRMGQLLEDAPVRRVRLQMMETEPLGEPLTTSVADGDSLRYYPAFRTDAAGSLPAPAPIVARHHMQLLMAQRLHGGLTIGDTHEYDEPFDFDLDEAPYEHLRERAESLLGRPLPPIRRRWAGVYAQALDEAICHRDEVSDGVVIVTGPGGRGMTLAPALAEQTLALLD